MSNTQKTPAELKAEQLKNAQPQPKVEDNTAPQDNISPDAPTVDNTWIVDEEIRLRELAEKKANDLEVENKKLKAELEKNNSKVITPAKLEPQPDKEPESLNHEMFMLTWTDRSVSFWGFTFLKWEKYAVSWRIKKSVEVLVEKKLWKILKD